MGTALARAVRETLRSPRLPAVLVLGTLLGLAVSSSAEGIWQLVTWLAMLLTFGYSLSYSREVALVAAPSLPPLGDVGAFLRRGAGQVVIASVSVVLLLPLLLLMSSSAEPARVASDILRVVYGVVMVIVLLPAFARYAYYDRVASGFHYLRAMRKVSATGIALAPVLVALVSAGLQQLVWHTLRTAFGTSHIPWPQALRSILALSAKPQDSWFFASSVLLGTFGVLTALLTSHLLGQVARLAFDQGDEPAVVLTSASS